MPTETKDHAAAGKSLDLLANDPERNAYTETLEQAPTLATATTTDGSIAPFPTAEFPDKLAEEVEYGAGGVKGLAENPYVFGAAFLASLGGFSFGYDQVGRIPCRPLLKEEGEEEERKGREADRPFQGRDFSY